MLLSLQFLLSVGQNSIEETFEQSRYDQAHVSGHCLCYALYMNCVKPKKVSLRHTVNFNGSNTDGSFIMLYSNLLSP